MDFSDPLYKHTFEVALRYIDPFYRDLATFKEKLNEKVQQWVKEEISKTDDSEVKGFDSTELINAQERKEHAAMAKANVKANNETMDYRCAYLQRVLCSIDDDEVRQLACDIATDNMPQLSKIHTQYTVIVEEKDRLLSLVPERLYNWKNALLVLKINDIKSQIAKARPEEIPQLMEQLQSLYSVRHQLAAIIGDRVVNPN
jgi:hypothetical protein